MKIEEKFVIRLLLKFEADDDGDGLSFYDHEYVSSNNYDLDFKNRALSFPNLDPKTRYHLKNMAERGQLDEHESTAEWSRYSLTALGHDVIEIHRQNAFYKRALRLITSWMDKAMTSILLPIVVSVLTVLALRFFDLE